ncbi:hypothetical protein B9Z55_022645 [Caenorhabditis nigoni]|uniref:Uncharacterized protein n=1 Tax=Caenorhabditis nigoni TaxID=1611254 RepID=A0A2G5SL46_9PELO|nr:hypothetical protein B9Z55_022645 [Caenorhabditis nigoni]
MAKTAQTRSNRHCPNPTHKCGSSRLGDTVKLVKVKHTVVAYERRNRVRRLIRHGIPTMKFDKFVIGSRITLQKQEQCDRKTFVSRFPSPRQRWLCEVFTKDNELLSKLMTT